MIVVMEFQKKRLVNGLRVIAVPMKNTNTVTVLVLVGTGSRYENRKNNGISHFLEHMFFKGTKRYPDAGELNKRLDAIGASHNAFTSKEDTGYWVKAHAKHFRLALGFVADILQRALIKKSEIERERGVIFEEMKMYLDTPRIYVWSVFERLLYGDQPAGWDTIGTAETLKAFYRPDFIAYLKKHYVARNAVVIVSGHIDGQTVFKNTEKEFRHLGRGRVIQKRKLRTPRKGPRVSVVTRSTDQTHLLLGVGGFSYNHKDRFVAEVLATILGGYMSSRLFMNIRERRGLAYSVSAVHHSYTDAGYLAVYAGIPHEAHLKVPGYVIEEFQKVRKNGVSAEELVRAKEHIRGRLAIALESTDEVASFFGSQEVLVGKTFTPSQVLAKIDKITRGDIQRVAKHIFTPSNYYLACIGAQLNEQRLLSVIS